MESGRGDGLNLEQPDGVEDAGDQYGKRGPVAAQHLDPDGGVGGDVVPVAEESGDLHQVADALAVLLFSEYVLTGFVGHKYI